MRASPSGVFQGHRRSISGRSKSTASVTRHLQQPTKTAAQHLSTKRFLVPDVQNGTASRNTRTSAGLVLPDPATGTCLIHNICHIASAIVIVVATVRNVPQIVKCWRSKSAFGLSAAALATEVSCYACTVAYGVRKGYAATLWGSELACWGQDMTLLGLVAVLRGVRLPVMGAIGLGMLALKSFLFTEIVPLWFLSKMQIFVGLILGLGARVPQIILNHRNRHTGNLALPTYLFNTTANLVCCTSTAIITGDIYVMVKEIWMLSLNATIVAQILKTLKKDKEAKANAAKTLPLPSTEIEERFRRHSVRLAGNWPRGSLSDDGDVPDAALNRRRNKRRGEVITGPGSWTLDTTSGSRRAGIKSHSLDSDNLSSLDDYESSQVDKKGSMDGMRHSLA